MKDTQICEVGQQLCIQDPEMMYGNRTLKKFTAFFEGNNFIKHNTIRGN
jgi:hypothetical protein